MDYYELNTTTNFTFLVGASHPEELVSQAINLGYSGIAITDECTLAGIVRAYIEIKNQIEEKKCSPSFQLIIGSRLKIDWQSQQDMEVILLCPCREAYAELSTLITRARRRAEKGTYQVKLKDLSQHINLCLCIWLPNKEYQDSHNQLKILAEIFPQKIWIGYHRLLQLDDYQSYLQCIQLAKNFNIPIVSQNKVLMHTKKRLKLQHCLTAIKKNQTIQSLGTDLIGNAEQSLRTLEALQNLYPENLLLETKTIAEQCHFSLKELRYEYPDEILPQSVSASEYLRQLCFQGAVERWPEGINDGDKKQLEYELEVIATLKYEHYFLTVYDIVQFARNQKILCQGRGSAANSLVCYCLFITEVSPQQSNLLFERFISEERKEPPDIDVDFEHQRREEVIQYIYKKYSRDRAALTATVITYRFKSAIRDVGKALGIDQPILEFLSKSIAWWDKPDSLQNYFKQMNLSGGGALAQLFSELVFDILKFPRHLSQHVGGFIITNRPMSELVPVENASMPDRTVIQWDKYDIEALGLLKVDVLGLGMLTMIRKCLELTASYSSISKLSHIKKEDERTYDMICNADTVGIFQIESRAQMSMLPRLRPRQFYDLVIQIAIVRPGPIQGNMVHPFLKRRNGEEKPTYYDEKMEEVLERTLGIPIFQEQVIQLSMVAAGFSGGEADQLRRAMATWGRNGDLQQFKEKLVKGMLKNGYPQEFAERLFEQMKGFGSYGFPESHSASFAILAYFSAWLKRHHTAAFYCALLNSQPMGFYSPSQLVQDAQKHRIKVLPVDIDHSRWESIIVFSENVDQDEKPEAIRLGMHLVKGFNEQAASRLIDERRQSLFTNIKDLVFRVKLNAIEKDALVQANTLPRLAKHRYQAQWQSLAIEESKPILIKLDSTSLPPSESELSLRAPTQVEDMVTDYQTVGLTLKKHPLAIMREKNWVEPCKRAIDLKKLRQGQFVKVSGVVTCRQRPGTASGVLFITLEDETGNMNIIVWKKTLEKFRKEILGSRLLLIKGTIERERKVVHIIAGHIKDISEKLPEFRRNSRDFH
ncbi:error-prone DNA polymerase [Aliikangiella coralliicola]|uniref:Error-prone DNA polymerase n=1 Tax=Aliikangiella coralliicola TaxID=2592383 RepID=A0A545U8Q5_9GAMM|nr:error-prone DNA polymerase [Aliikangiella coralliicola]TQV85846.1 DNA polymerase III subunit alpha [Aliikangiella coralliicola]